MEAPKTAPKKHITVNGHKYTLKTKRQPSARNNFMSAEMRKMDKSLTQPEKFKRASAMWNELHSEK